MTVPDANPRILIQAKGLTKVFDRVAVLVDANLDIRGGEIHALVGANGSGKSTLIKILSGYHQPSAGQVTAIPDPQTGGEPAVAFVHQDLGLIDSMSVLENVALSCGYTTGFLGRVRWKEMRGRAAELLDEFGLMIRAGATVGSLGGTERRLVAIARATHSLGTQNGVLVLDEPTAALPPDEVHKVLEVMKVVARRHSGVLWVCHNLKETLSVAHTVTVLRNGRVVANVDASGATVEQLAGYMFGSGGEALADADSRRAKVVPTARAHSAETDGAPAIRLRGVSAKMLKGVDLDVWPGEVVGVTGLVGCGKSELGRVIAGAQRVTAGVIAVHGTEQTSFKTPRQALDRGIAYVPPDRRRSGGVLSMDARENVTLSTVDSFFDKGWLRKSRELKSVARQMDEVGAVPAKPRQAFSAFSGGNQQKLVFARVLRLSPRVVVLDDPTQGVDVETIPELYRFIRSMAAQGCGVVVITADIDELVEVSDRVVVLEDGALIDELRNDRISVESIGVAVAGGRREGPIS
jgi:ribose transport system ATP-binding protein